MIKQQKIKKAIIALTVVATLGTSMTAFAKSSFTGEYRQGEILSFGSSLNQKEEQALREYFGVPSDMEAIYVDNETAIKQLGLDEHALDNYTGGWYSSAYVKLTDQGGINVSSNNVSLVTNEMYANALMTSGILNCEVIVSAPFVVTGESALAGILAGAEEIMGESLPEQNKAVAQEEIETTLDVADEILNDDSNNIDNTTDSSIIASGIMNDIKEQVIKDSPNAVQIGQIVTNVTNNYGVDLSEETKEQIVELMENVNELDIDYKDIKETMENIGSRISDSLKEAGIQLKDSGVLEKIGQWFSNIIKSIGEWLNNLFTSTNESNQATENEDVIVEPEPTTEEVNESEEEVIEETEEIQPEIEETEEIIEEEVEDSDEEIVHENQEAELTE